MDVFQPSLLPPVSTEPQFTDELESALSEYESRLQNTRDGNAAIKNWRMGNYNAVSEIMQRNPNIGIRLDGRLTLMGSQAADYLLNNNGFGSEVNAYLGYAGPFTFNAVGGPNQDRSFNKDERTAFNSGLGKAKEVLRDNSTCRNAISELLETEGGAIFAPVSMKPTTDMNGNKMQETFHPARVYVYDMETSSSPYLKLYDYVNMQSTKELGSDTFAITTRKFKNGYLVSAPIKWNQSFFKLSKDARALHIIHEIIHQFTGDIEIGNRIAKYEEKIKHLLMQNQHQHTLTSILVRSVVYQSNND